MLSNALKQLKTSIDESDSLTEELTVCLKKDRQCYFGKELDPTVSAYLIVAWILEYNSASNGLGFPFDQPHLEFYLRMQDAYPVLKKLKSKGVSVLPLVRLNRVLSDSAIKKLVSRIEDKTSVFNELREAMRIADPKNGQGLNDEGDDDIKTIECRVKQFRYSSKIQKMLSNNDTSYHKMIKQIDKYWDKLFADPIEVDTPNGKVTLQPQRTNNMLEQFFRFLKRNGRKKSGQLSLGKALKGMLAETPLVRNLENPEYLDILLRGKKSLAERFSEIDIQLVHQEEKKSAEHWRKYPKRMGKIFKLPDLPQKMMNMASK